MSVSYTHLKKHFNPQYALNMDGGGSTTMYVKPFGLEDFGKAGWRYPEDLQHSGRQAGSGFAGAARNG